MSFISVLKAGVVEGRFRPGVENSSDVARFRLRMEEGGSVLRDVTNCGCRWVKTKRLVLVLPND